MALQEPRILGALSWADRYGRVLTACCAVHCLLMPVALVLFPFWLGRALRHEGAHLLFVSVSVFLGAWSFWQGQRAHGRRSIALFALAAAGMVLIGELFLDRAPWWHAAISASAGLALAFGHHLNLRWCKDAQCDCPSHDHA